MALLGCVCYLKKKKITQFAVKVLFMFLQCLKLFLICCLCSLSFIGLRELEKTYWATGREAGKPEAETKVGLVLKNK